MDKVDFVKCDCEKILFKVQFIGENTILLTCPECGTSMTIISKPDISSVAKDISGTLGEKAAESIMSFAFRKMAGRKKT